jgi:hypothetical protein
MPCRRWAVSALLAALLVLVQVQVLRVRLLLLNLALVGCSVVQVLRALEPGWAWALAYPLARRVQALVWAWALA